jgi:membrane protein
MIQRFPMNYRCFRCTMGFLGKINASVQTLVWRTDLTSVTTVQRNFIRAFRATTVAIRCFTKHQCPLKASALTFYTLLSIVPVVAMLFGVAKGFGLEKRMEAELRSNLSYNQEMIAYVVDFAASMLENTKGGLIAGLGVVILFWSVTKVLGNIEEAFNDIWGITQSRNWARKFSDYMSIMLLAPVLIIVSGSITVFISTQVEFATTHIPILGRIGPLIYFGLRFLPVLLNVVLFAGVYTILPNTKVKLSAAVFGALFAAVIFMIIEWVYLTFQIGVSNYNTIYGGFAALPLFLVWVQTSWLVVLFGAELSAAFQNQTSKKSDSEPVELSFANRFVLAVAVVQALIRRFQMGDESPSAVDLSNETQISATLVRPIIGELIQCHVVAEVVGNNSDEPTYLPAIDIAKMDFGFVLRRLMDLGSIELPNTEQLSTIEETVSRIQVELARSQHNRPIKDL